MSGSWGKEKRSEISLVKGFRLRNISKRFDCSVCLFFFFQTFCSVYGAGPAIAKKWYALGLRTIEDVKKRFDQLDVNDDKMITYGTTPFQNAYSRSNEFEWLLFCMSTKKEWHFTTIWISRCCCQKPRKRTSTSPTWQSSSCRLSWQAWMEAFVGKKKKLLFITSQGRRQSFQKISHLLFWALAVNLLVTIWMCYFLIQSAITA